MTDDILLTDGDFDEILKTKSQLFCPDPTGIKVGDRLLMYVKIGGEMELTEVWIRRAPYHPDKRKYLYVDVYGWGIRKSVNVTKLLKRKEQEK